MTAGTWPFKKQVVFRFQARAVPQEAGETPLTELSSPISVVYRREKGEQLYNAFGGFAGLLRYSTGV